jgi:hypothetical protein
MALATMLQSSPYPGLKQSPSFLLQLIASVAEHDAVDPPTRYALEL